MAAKRIRANANILGLLICILLGYTTGGLASASPIPGTEFSIASITGTARYAQEYVDVCAGGGMYLAVWQDKRSNVDYDIYGILLDANGVALTAESFLISKMAGGAAAPSDQLYPAVGFNGTNFLVAWADRRAVDLIYRIYATRVTTAGVVLDPDGIAFPTAATRTDQFVPQIASNGIGWEVIWQEKSSTGSDDVYGIAVSSSGTVGSRVAIAYRIDNEQWPTIAWNGTNFLVVWQDLRNAESTGTDIYGSRLTSAGAKVTSSEKMISTAVGSSTNGAAGAQTVPSVAANGSGTWLIVWQDARSGVDDDIYCARMNSAGTVQDLGGVPVSLVTNDQEEPSVGWDGTNFLTAWRDKNASYGIRGARINSSAVVQDTSGILITSAAAGQYGPAIASQSGSSLVGLYTLDMSPNVYGVRVTSAGVVGSLTEWSICVQDQPQFSAAFDGTNYTVAWADRRSGMYRVYAARVSTSGTVLDASGVLVTTSASGDQTQPAISWNGTNYLVAWTEQGATWTDIKGMRLTTALARVDASPMSLCVVDQDQHSPAIAWSGSNWLVAWVDYRSAVAPNYYCDIRGARVTAAGVITAVSAIGGADNNQWAPSVASCGGNFLVAYEDYRSGSSVVYCNRVTSAGTVLDIDAPHGVYGVMVPSTAYYNVQPKVASDGTNYFIVWSDKRAGWSNDNVYGVRMSTAAARLDPADILVCGATKAQVAPSAFYNGTNYLVAWQDYRNSSTAGYDIYLNQVSAAGTVVDLTDRLISGGPHSEVNPAVLATGGQGLALYSNSINATYRTAGRILSEPPPVPVVTDDGAYSMSPNSLHATWSAAPRQAEVAEYRYAIGTTAGGTEVVGWTSAGLLTGVTHIGLSLTDGVIYYFAVQTRNSSGTWGDPGMSNGITVDASAPTIPSVTDDGAYLTSSSLHATWSSGDPHTGVQEYQYAIGTSSGAIDVVGWTSTGTGTGITRSDLTLADGTSYFFSVRARNAAGGWSIPGNSNGIMYDASAPSTPVVTDDGAYTASSASLHAAWTSSDPHSGIQEYQYAIGTTVGGIDIVGWTSTGTTAEVTHTGLSLSDGTTYYFSVKAKNGAGTWSTAGDSDGIAVDTSAPTAPVVTDDGAYTTDVTSLHATWTASESESGIDEYQYAIGTSMGGNNIVDWTSTGTTAEVTHTGLSLSDGTTYYFAVKAKNGAGTWGAVGNSDGIMVDTSAPTTPVVTDDGVYTTSATTLQATWTASDPQSGIQEYQYAIGTSIGGNNIVDWTTTGTTAGVTRTGLSLIDGTAYYFSVRARNGAGAWGTAGNSNGITADASAPTTPVVTDDGAYTTNATSLHATWTASDPQSGILEYQYAIGTSVGGNNIVDWTSTGTTASVTRTGLSLVDGTAYYFSVRARNSAGTWGAAGNSNGITADVSAPSTPIVTDDGEFVSSNTLHATWASSDPHSGIQEYQYAIGTSIGGNNLVDWTSTGTTASVTRAGLSLIDGTAYFFSVRARNGAGTWSTAGNSDGIVVDTTPPTRPVVVDDGDYMNHTTLHATWTSGDPHSGIQEYQYALGTTLGGNNVLDWTSTGTTAAVSKTGLSLTDGLTYYFMVRARNGAGAWSLSGNSNGIIVDSSAPTMPVVTDDGVYTASSSSLHATWTTSSDPQSGILEYQYSIGTYVGGSNIVDWTTTGMSTAVTRTGLSLIDGATYYFSVKSRNGADTWSSAGNSDGITAEGSPPTTPVVTDDGTYTMSSTSLHATWTSSDPQSGIQEYQYAIGTSVGGNNIVDWTSTGTTASVTRTGLSLIDGTAYYFSVRARNGAGAWSLSGNSNGIVVDASAPSTPVVTDDGSYTTSSTSLHATWTASDPQSGIQEYQYAIGTSIGGNNIVDWTSTGTTASVTRTGLSLIDGTAYYFSVRARNGAGALGTAGNSNGIVVDGSAPSTPVVTDDGVYTTNATTLHATWTASDPQSGIQEYLYAIGSSIGGNNIADWTSTGTTAGVTRTGLSLIDGTAYYFSVRARNGAGTLGTAGNSDGITADASAPSTPVVTDDGAYTTSSSSLHASWAASDPQSGIVEYQYAIGTSIGGNNIVDWTSTGTTASVTRTGLSLVDGTTYYFSVRARNGAGTWGTAGNSNGIAADASAPTIPVVLDDGAYTANATTLHASWGASDPQSGIQEYQYAIGSSIGGNNIVDWTSTGTTTGVTRTGLSLIDGTAYFFSVRARNGAGAWGTSGNSDGITADVSAPSTPAVTDDGAYTSSSSSLHATWTASSDPHSGIQEYQYAIGTSIGGNNTVDWTSTGMSIAVTKTGLSLVDGTTYYFSVKSRNGAGAWGTAGNSDGITMASDPPSTPVVTDDGDYTLPDILHATWVVANPHGAIMEYQLSIGTSVGGTNILGWTSAGTATDVTRTLLSLEEGNTYYMNVKARNAAGLWSAVGSSNGIAVPPAFTSILDAKSVPNGQPMRLSGKVVTAGTASLPDLPGPAYFYIQESNSIIGIKVVNSTTIATGSVVEIAGVIQAPDGERQITASVARVVSPSGTVPGAINMADRAIGGAALNLYTPGVYMDSGPHNVGSIVKSWGKVTYAGGVGADYFYLNGGCFLRDGSGHVGIKVYCGTLTKPAVGSSVLITGISSCEPLSSNLVRRVLATEIIEYP